MMREKWLKDLKRVRELRENRERGSKERDTEKKREIKNR